MTDVFKSYTNTVKNMLLRYDRDLASAFIDSNIEEIWQSHDNWNGGIDFYLIKLYLPLDVYFKFKDTNRIKDAESEINSYYEEILKGEESTQINGVVISPRADSQMDFGVINDDTMWRPGYFRLFISHVTTYKVSASNLKKDLAFFGIDCFVAHEDITPSKEWEIEIEKGLFTMDALCAIVVPEFIQSKWCDQEVGIALGQHKLVVSISKGENPYGFFGKFQALKAKPLSSEMAKDVWRAITMNERTKEIYSEKLINLLLNAKIDKECEAFIDVLKQFTSIDRRHIVNLHNHYSDNPLLMEDKNLIIANQIFTLYGLNEIAHNNIKDNVVEYEGGLPF